MIKLERILVPTDFSPFAGEALKYACTLVERFDAELHLLHVLDVLRGVTPQFGMGLAVAPHMTESAEDAEGALAEIVDAAWAEGRRVVPATADGSPFVGIIRYARDHDIDMIVMATHGRSGLSHMLLGSVTEKVVRKSPCPVLTVRPEGHEFVMP